MTASPLAIVEQNKKQVNSAEAMQRIVDLDSSLRRIAGKLSDRYDSDPTEALDCLYEFLTGKAAQSPALFENTDAYILRAAYFHLNHVLWHARRDCKYSTVSLDDIAEVVADEDAADWDDEIDRRARILAVREFLDRMEPALRDVARLIMEFNDQAGRINVAGLARKAGVPAQTLRHKIEALRCALRPLHDEPDPLGQIAQIVEERCARLQAELETLIGDKALYPTPKLTISYQLT